MPGEEQGASAGALRERDDLERSEVIRLFVGVDHVPPLAAKVATEPRIEVGVKMAVERQRLDHQAIALRMPAVELEHLPAVIAPGGRHHDRQLGAAAGQLLQLALVGAVDAGFGDHQDAHGARLPSLWATVPTPCGAGGP